MNIGRTGQVFSTELEYLEGGRVEHPEADGPPSRGVRVWRGDKLEGGGYAIEPRNHNLSEVPDTAEYVIETILDQTFIREHFATTREEAMQTGREEWELIRDAPVPDFNDTHRDVVMDALDFDDLQLLCQGGDHAVQLDSVAVRACDRLKGYSHELVYTVTVNYRGTLTLDEAEAHQGRLLAVTSHGEDQRISVTLKGYKDGNILVDVVAAHSQQGDGETA
jgi:hypothetical protein